MKQKAQTVICPHCEEDFDVKENGRYICPEFPSSAASAITSPPGANHTSSSSDLSGID